MAEHLLGKCNALSSPPPKKEERKRRHVIWCHLNKALKQQDKSILLEIIITVTLSDGKTACGMSLDLGVSCTGGFISEKFLSCTTMVNAHFTAYVLWCQRSVTWKQTELDICVWVFWSQVLLSISVRRERLDEQKGQANCKTVTPKASGHPTGDSVVRIALQGHPKLRLRSWVFTCPQWSHILFQEGSL